MNQQAQTCHNLLLVPIFEGPKCDLFGRLDSSPGQISYQYKDNCEALASKFISGNGAEIWLGTKDFWLCDQLSHQGSTALGKVTQNTSTWIKLCPIIDKCTSKALGMSLTKGRALWLHKGFTARTVTIQKAIFLASFVLAYLLRNVFFWWVDLICKLKSHCTILKTTARLSRSNCPVGMSVRYYLVGIPSL